jgi:ferredoxin
VSGAKLNMDISSTEVNNPRGKYLKKLNIIKPLADADLIINLPKLKTHGQMVYTGAVKNMFGAVPGLEKAEYHMRMPKYGDFADALIDIFLSVKPALNIMDAIIGMDGAGPSAGNPKPIGLVLASEDAFALDYAACLIIGTDPINIPMMKQGSLRGLTPTHCKDIEWIGETLEKVRVGEFHMPQLEHLQAITFFEKGPLKPLLNLITPKPSFDKAKCIGCARCADNCPVRIIKMKDKKPTPDLSKCIRCFCCQELCPVKAVTIRRSKVGSFIMNQGASSLMDMVNRVRTKLK